MSMAIGFIGEGKEEGEVERGTKRKENKRTNSVQKGFAAKSTPEWATKPTPRVIAMLK